MIERPILVWFRQDLRIADNPALHAAAVSGAPVLPVYVLDDAGAGRWRMGGASRWWLHSSLAALDRSLQALGAALTLRQGPTVETLLALVAETNAQGVCWNGHPEPHWCDAERRLETALTSAGVAAHPSSALTLFPLAHIRGRQGQPFRVFTAFWRACLAATAPAPPIPAPATLQPLADPPAGDDPAKWQLQPVSPDWAGGLRETWQPGEVAGRQRLVRFLDERLAGYAANRDRPGLAATSELSPYLHFGEVSARQVWHTTLARAAAEPALANAAEAFLRQLGWREFSVDILLNNPAMAEEPLQARFTAFPWEPDDRLLAAWQRGRTGYPIVDAGMRQLWETGWMHNRVRMIVASFLVKHLLQPWQAGEAWFWDTLVDADLANNAGGWQWVAGCGCDAAPCFRIFNPISQGERFDADGAYIRRWLPALARVPDRWLHRPWEAPPLELAAARVRLGVDYPNRLIEHATARTRALAAFAKLKTNS